MLPYRSFLLALILWGQYSSPLPEKESTRHEKYDIPTANHNNPNEPDQNSSCRQLMAVQNDAFTVIELDKEEERNHTKCTNNNHIGLPYEKCKDGCTMAIGSNKCIENSDKLCTDFLAAFIILFLAAGILLVLVIKILNLTVSQGAVHGLIFYANVAWAYESLFSSENCNHIVCQVLRMFIAWINLDFGHTVCLLKNFDLYTKTWLQYLFPLYICTITAVIIILSRCSQRITRLFGNNSVHVLATLFILSHAKLLRIIMIATQPFLSPGNDTDPGKLVWAYDSQMEYVKDTNHILLFAVAGVLFILLWLPFTLILLFVQPLRSCSHFRLCRFVNKLVPFLDAYTGPFQP